MDSEIYLPTSDAEIQACFPLFSVLRPHVKEENFVPQVRRQQAESYSIVALRAEGEVRSAAGFRFAEFLAWGKILYIDDLVTLPNAKARGYAGALMDWLLAHARERECNSVHLDTGYTRHAAHKLYLKKGLRLDCHHLAMDIASPQ